MKNSVSQEKIDSEQIFEQEWSSGKPSSLPLREYLSAAAACFEYEQPSYDEGWKSPLWDFTRAAKGHPQLCDLPGTKALSEVEKWLRSQRQSWTKAFPDTNSQEDAQTEFLHIWEVIRFAPGRTPLESALQKARQHPLVASNHRTDGYDRFLSVAGWLQVIMGDRNILLPCHKLALTLGVQHTTVARYRKFGIEGRLPHYSQAAQLQRSGGTG